MKLPTHSSDWTNFLRLQALIQASGSPEYKRALERLFRDQKGEKNPFFNAIYLLVNPKSKKKIELEKETAEYMNSFPLSLDDREIINSKRDIDKKIFPPLIKNSFRKESKRPLLIYQRPCESHEWRKNPFRLDDNIGSKGRIAYPGIDFLLAYWVHKYEQTPKKITTPIALVVEDRKLTRDKVKAHLENEGYTVLQASTLKEAKSFVNDYSIEKIITDLDLTVTSGNMITHKNDGYEFVDWLHNNRFEGNVILHSTMFNKNDLFGTLLSIYVNNIKKKVEDMGYKTQPKTVILGK